MVAHVQPRRSLRWSIGPKPSTPLQIIDATSRKHLPGNLSSSLLLYLTHRGAIVSLAHSLHQNSNPGYVNKKQRMLLLHSPQAHTGQPPSPKFLPVVCRLYSGLGEESPKLPAHPLGGNNHLCSFWENAVITPPEVFGIMDAVISFRQTESRINPCFIIQDVLVCSNLKYP